MAASTAYVNQILPKDAAGVSIPGHVVQYKTVTTSTPISLSAGTGWINILSLSYTPINPNNKLMISVNIPNLRKTTGAGTNTWFGGLIRIDGQEIPEGNLFGAVGYPETFNDQRYMIHSQIEASAYSGTKTISFLGNSSSSGSEWIVSYQDNNTKMVVMEIAQ
jgi:hypothetical protein